MSGGSPLLRNSGAAGATDGIAQVFIFYSAFPPHFFCCFAYFVFVSVSCFFLPLITATPDIVSIHIDDEKRRIHENEKEESTN